MSSQSIEIFPVTGIPEIHPGNDLLQIISDSVQKLSCGVRDGDVFVVAQKIVSKAESKIVRLDSITPSERAVKWAERWGKDARQVEIALRESKRIVRMDRGLVISETHHGFICANAGVDASNAPAGCVILLPGDPDASANRLRNGLESAFAVRLAIVVSDTFGRPWRRGLTNVALGVSGIAPMLDYRGTADRSGKTLHATVLAIADEIAGAAELVMGKAEGIPVAIVRGAPVGNEGTRARDLIRDAESDLFR